MLSFSIDKNPFQIRHELAQKVKFLRKQKKYSQQELAQRSNVSLGSYKRFERSGQISLEALLRIVFILDRLEEFDKLLIPNHLIEIEKLFKEEK
jgi:transcriptional regulator with XRE-family HTH domain